MNCGIKMEFGFIDDIDGICILIFSQVQIKKNINGKTFDEAAYDAFVTDIVDQQIKDNTGYIRNFCGIVGSINAEVFKKNLAKVIDDSMQVYKELERVIFQRA